MEYSLHTNAESNRFFLFPFSGVRGLPKPGDIRAGHRCSGEGDRWDVGEGTPGERDCVDRSAEHVRVRQGHTGTSKFRSDDGGDAFQE